jgi:predicted nucleotidyltransferase
MTGQPIMQTIREQIEAKRDNILALAASHGAHNIRLFGSVLRGEATSRSDVDFLVQMDDGRTLLDLIGLSQDLEELLHCKVDVVTDRGISPYLKERITAEAAPL